MTFTWRVFSKCFRPQSSYPSDLSGLITWLRADSGLTFSIPTKRVSAWEDQSGNTNSVAQTVKDKRALRYTYDGANDKTRISFNGTTDYFTSNGNSPIGADFTMFFVAQVNVDVNETSKYFYYVNGDTKLIVGSSNNKLKFNISDSDGESGTLTLPTSDTSSYHICVVRHHNKHIYLDFNNTLSDSLNISTYNHTQTFNSTTFNLGSSGVAPSAPPVPSDYYDYLNGNMQEFIVYNSSLDSYKIGQVKSYLNKKYNIY